MEASQRLLARLRRVISLSGERAFREGLFANRPNEAGNRIERFVREALNEAGLAADTPKTKSGKRKSAGYPDIQVVDEWGHFRMVSPVNPTNNHQSFSIDTFCIC